MRADALRNREAILAAAEEVFRESAQASMADVASRAGVGRVTLYAHFANRGELIDAVFERTVTESSAHLSALDLAGDEVEALTRLIESSWRVVHRERAILAVAEQELPTERIRAHNDASLKRVRDLIERGQQSARFRRDLSADWLTSVFFSTVHGAAAEIEAGRLPDDEAGDVVLRTLTSLFTAR